MKMRLDQRIHRMPEPAADVRMPAPPRLPIILVPVLANRASKTQAEADNEVPF